MEKILETINSPADLKLVSKTQLTDLAAEIRTFMLNSVSESGGHLAPNLGVVELTIALHYIFTAPDDKIIWDVGHQSYVHKILTGRRQQMAVLRKYKGMSGFPKITESIYDAFGTGHSSTSISAALGMAIAREQLKEKHTVLAVIGDGALTGGMSWEALNHAGALGLDLTIILNDNAMSISPNVGAFSSYLSKIRTSPHYSRTKSELEQGFSKIPAIGGGITKIATRLKDTVKTIVIPGLIFRELGFNYIGPINGHDFDELLPVLKNIKDMHGPILLHVVTHKGQGYEPAAAAPQIFHGVGPFDVTTGQPLAEKNAAATYTQVFSENLLALAAKYDHIVAITAAMADGTRLTPFKSHYPERFLDVGICEQHAVTMSSALALAGLKPIVCIYSSFMQRAYDQLIHDVAIQDQPVVFILDRAGLVGDDGATHHGVFDFAFLRSIPNMSIMSPASADDLRQMLAVAIQWEHPVAIRFSRGSIAAEENILPSAPLNFGKAQIVKSGEQVAIIAVGNFYNIAYDLYQLLARDGIQATLINARFIKPLDTELLLSLSEKHKYFITLENNLLAGGFGSAVAEFLSDQSLNDIKLWRIGLPDRFIQQGDISLLLEEVGISAEQLWQQIQIRWPEIFVAQEQLCAPQHDHSTAKDLI